MNDLQPPAAPLGTALDWSAEELAKLAEVTPADIERAKREAPDVSVRTDDGVVSMRELLGVAPARTT